MSQYVFIVYQVFKAWIVLLSVSLATLMEYLGYLPPSSHNKLCEMWARTFCRVIVRKNS